MLCSEGRLQAQSPRPEHSLLAEWASSAWQGLPRAWQKQQRGCGAHLVLLLLQVSPMILCQLLQLFSSHRPQHLLWGPQDSQELRPSENVLAARPHAGPGAASGCHGQTTARAVRNIDSPAGRAPWLRVSASSALARARAEKEREQQNGLWQNWNSQDSQDHL